MAQETETQGTLAEAIPQAVEAWGLKFWPLDLLALSKIEKKFGGLGDIKFGGITDAAWFLCLSVGSTTEGRNMTEEDLMKHVPAKALVDGTATAVLEQIMERSGLAVQEESEAGNPPDAEPEGAGPPRPEETAEPPVIGDASSGSSESTAVSIDAKYLR